MEIDKRITNIWTVTIHEDEVFNRVTDEGIQEENRLAAAPRPRRASTSQQSILISDDDRATLHRYYCTALAELSAVLARRTSRVGGSIENNKDENGMLVTVYTLAMTENHESELLPALASHCLEFLIAKVMEKWYGHGAEFGSREEKEQIKHVLHYRRFPIERPGSIM